MQASRQAAVTPAGIRDGDPAVLAALVERRSNAVLAYCEAVLHPGLAERAAAEAFARFRVAVGGFDDPKATDPDALLLGATRHAAASLVPPPPPAVQTGLVRRLAATRGQPGDTEAVLPSLLAARAQGELSAEDEERLRRHLARHAPSRAVEAAFARAEAAYRKPPERTVPIGALTEIMAALAHAAPNVALVDDPGYDLSGLDGLVLTQPPPAGPDHPSYLHPVIADERGGPEPPVNPWVAPDPSTHEGATAAPPASVAPGDHPSGTVAPRADPPAAGAEPAATPTSADPAATDPPAGLEPGPAPTSLDPAAPDPPAGLEPAPAPTSLDPAAPDPPAGEPSGAEPAPAERPAAAPPATTAPAADASPSALRTSLQRLAATRLGFARGSRPSAAETPADGAAHDAATVLARADVAATQPSAEVAPAHGAAGAARPGAEVAPAHGAVALVDSPAGAADRDVDGERAGGSALPRPPRRHLHLPPLHAPDTHGALYRYVLPGGACAVAVVTVLAIAGVFDGGSPSGGATSAPVTGLAAPPAGSPPVVTPDEERVLRAQRRNQRAAAKARREREQAAAVAGTTGTSGTSGAEEQPLP